MNEVTKAVVEDVNALVKSYNYDDCDGMIDYFDVNFYYFGCCENNGASVKIVPKIARIKAKKSEVKTAAHDPERTNAPESITATDDKSIPACDTEKPQNDAQKTGYTYKITRGEDTRDGSTIWIVRIIEKLDQAAYIAENKAMKARGAYYSRYAHGFLFRVDPSDILKTA